MDKLARLTVICISLFENRGTTMLSWRRWKLLLGVVIVAPLLLLIHVLFQEREWTVHKGSLGGMANETVDVEAHLEEEGEDEEELFSEKPTPLWATFDPNEVRTDREIFFVALNGLLSPRQACMAEAAAIHHPHRRVFLLLTSNFSTAEVLDNSPTGNLASLPNVRLRHLPVTQTFRFTKLWDWYLKSDWQKDPSLADDYLGPAIGLLLLYKHGGLLLSWSTLTLASLPFPGLAECGPDSLAPFVSLPARHELSERLLDSAQLSLNPAGLSLSSLEATLRKVCKVEHLIRLGYSPCLSLPQILPSPKLCPVEQKRSWVLFDPKRKQIARREVGETSLMVNLWLEESGELAQWASDQDCKSHFLHLAENHCPIALASNNNSL